VEHPISLIVIDDEPLAREAFSRVLSERFGEFLLSGEADSGPSGLTLFRNVRPQIVIMDIQMPGFDGLEASRIILKESPGTQIIVLSAYDDFRYVQEALHGGVLGYLLKPVKEDKLQELLEKAAERIRLTDRSIKDKMESRTWKSLAVRDQVASFLYGSHGGISADVFAALSDPPIRSGYFLVFCTEGDRTPGSREIQEINLRLDRLEGCLPGHWMGRYLTVFVQAELSTEEAWRSEAEFLSREIQYLIQEIASVRTRVGVGPVVASAPHFGDSFRAAFDMLQEDSDKREVVFSSRDRERESRVDRYPVIGEAGFLSACRASDGTAALKAATELADDLISPEASLMDARFAVTEFLIVFRREWESLSGEPKRRAVANLLREALLCADHSVLRDWFLLVVRDLVRHIGHENDGDDLTLRKVRHFIDLNDLREVSLETASASLGITPSYLSRLFKEKTGGHFHEYVMERRLEMAARLLRETALPVHDVSHRVGYGDAAYFGKVFRKHYGSTPRDYRKGL
jgi:two-component system response regulator YesN